MNFSPNAMMKKQFEKMIYQRFGSVDNMMNDMSKFAGNNPTLKNALDLYKNTCGIRLFYNDNFDCE
jgi:hypothetical protein